ncbi:MAG TPA: phosphotransferase, partial [Methanomicrobiales archaeon]|nr:phosphotransferase [Methanomicrobiales archaeon]
QHNGSLPRHLTLLANLHRRIHAYRSGIFDKERIFSGYNRIFHTLRLRPRDRDRFEHLLSAWRDQPLLDLSCGHRIHGDANPNNYILHGKQFHALDFEQSWDQAHPIHDVGIICTELTHFFATKRGDPHLAKEYIHHYLHQYCRDERDLEEITQVLPFFMSYGYMRIARLYRNTPYQDYIVQEALELLDSGQKTLPRRSALLTPAWTSESAKGTRA